MIFLNFLHCEPLKARNLFFSHPQDLNRSCLCHQKVFIPSNSLTKVTRLGQLFPESQDCGATKRTPEGHPERQPRMILTLTKTSQTGVRCSSGANLQSVLSGGFWCVNTIKASAYYLFHCAWRHTPRCSDKTRLMSVDVSEVETGRR